MAIVICDAIAANAITRVSQPMIVLRNAVGKSSVTAELPATSAAAPNDAYQQCETPSQITGLRKFRGGPQ